MPVVLVVDDEPDALLLLTIVLRKEGFEVRTAPDGVEAMEICASGGIDIVVTDLTMPRMDGNGLIRSLRSTEGLSAIPVVVVSARPEDVEGADAVLPKPFANRDLVAQVRALLPGSSPPA